MLRDVCTMLRVGHSHQLIAVLGHVVRVATAIPQLEQMRWELGAPNAQEQMVGMLQWEEQGESRGAPTAPRLLPAPTLESSAPLHAPPPPGATAAAATAFEANHRALKSAAGRGGVGCRCRR